MSKDAKPFDCSCDRCAEYRLSLEDTIQQTQAELAEAREFQNDRIKKLAKLNIKAISEIGELAEENQQLLDECERAKKDLAIYVNTRFNNELIEQSLSGFNMDDRVKGIIKLKDEGIRQALSELGWKSPEEAEQLKTQLDEVVEELKDSINNLELRCDTTTNGLKADLQRYRTLINKVEEGKCDFPCSLCHAKNYEDAADKCTGDPEHRGCSAACVNKLENDSE